MYVCMYVRMYACLYMCMCVCMEYELTLSLGQPSIKCVCVWDLQGFFSVTYSACATNYQQGDHPMAARDGPTKRPQQMRIRADHPDVLLIFLDPHTCRFLEKKQASPGKYAGPERSEASPIHIHEGPADRSTEISSAALAGSNASCAASSFLIIHMQRSRMVVSLHLRQPHERARH